MEIVAKEVSGVEFQVHEAPLVPAPSSGHVGGGDIHPHQTLDPIRWQGLEPVPARTTQDSHGTWLQAAHR